MTQPKKLIEVAMPIKEISAESVRDKSIRHGHISTLHLWWARRPLPVCRAVVFASLVPDPLDEHCPKAFRDAVALILCREFQIQQGGTRYDWYKPYNDIPYTAAIDKMDDNLRNRLLMFIGKFSHKFIANQKMGKDTPAKDLLSEASLIRWDNKNNELIIGMARKLIFVAHQLTSLGSTKSAETLLDEFDSLYKSIKKAEDELYNLSDRHIETELVRQKTEALHQATEAFLDRMPRVFDPFAGGGAIPLEAARLGCRSFGNDINPVAHIIQKGSLEFPQKYGKPITYSRVEFLKLYGEEALKRWCEENGQHLDTKNLAITIDNRLSFDVEHYARKLLALSEKEIGQYYPADENGNKPIAYYWARVGTCSNPSCGAQVPLLKQFYLANTKNKQVHLKPIINGTDIQFEIKEGKYDVKTLKGWNNRGNLTCPCCGSVTDVKTIKNQSLADYTKDRLVAVIIEGEKGKEYRLPTKMEIKILYEIPEIKRPFEMMQRNSAGGDTFSWGVSVWGQLFSPRQLLAMQTLVNQLHIIKQGLDVFDPEYKKAVTTYLGIWLDRVTVANTSFGVWHVGRETLERPMGRQAIPMVFDFPESNPFCTSSGSASNQLDWLTRYIESEGNNSFYTVCNNASSGDKHQFGEKYITAVVTDPPYYDAIAYADLSDFFYVWLKRTLSDFYQLNFSTPQTPKGEECTALKHHHNGSIEKAKKHFEKKLLHIFDALEHQTSDLLSIMFAHQSTEAWTTLCNSILGARMNITGSWATDTELTGALKKDKSFLASSVTVCAKPYEKNAYGDFKDVKKAIESTVAREVEELYQLGFRGPDLLTACFGQAVSEFGKYEKVEKADGSEVKVAELLELARESAFNALLKGFDGDDFTKFYIAWLQLYGFTESDFDDAAKFSRVGLSINVNELFTRHILIKNGNKQTLGSFAERLHTDPRLGERDHNILIDQVHKAMHFYSGTNRNALLQYIGKVASDPGSSFWRVLNSLCEVLPAGSSDHTQAAGLLANKESIIRDSKKIQIPENLQQDLFNS